MGPAMIHSPVGSCFVSKSILGNLSLSSFCIAGPDFESVKLQQILAGMRLPSRHFTASMTR